MPASALAQTAPDQGLIVLKYVDYRDWQPGGDRIHVHSPSLYLLKPLSDSLAAEGSLVYDSISGASPLYHNTLSGASGKGGVTDYRTAGNEGFDILRDNETDALGKTVGALHEWIGLIAYWLTGKIDEPLPGPGSTASMPPAGPN